jgi:hypothetical protein
MLFVLDASGVPSVAKWVQLRGDAPDAADLPIGAVPSGGTPDPGPTDPGITDPGTTGGGSAPIVEPPADRTAPRIVASVARVRAGSRRLRLRVRLSEHGRVTAVAKAKGLNRRVTLQLTAGRTREVRFALPARAGKAGARISIAIRATDAHGNARTKRLVVRVRR